MIKQVERIECYSLHYYLYSVSGLREGWAVMHRDKDGTFSNMFYGEMTTAINCYRQLTGLQ